MRILGATVFWASYLVCVSTIISNYIELASEAIMYKRPDRAIVAGLLLFSFTVVFIHDRLR